MAYFRRDDRVTDANGVSLPNVFATYYVQPALTLATVYTDATGTTIAPNPQLTNSLGQTTAYLSPGTYTVVYSGPKIQTYSVPDQIIGAATGASSAQAQGTVDGTNPNFTFTSASSPTPAIALFVGGIFQTPGVDYNFTYSGASTWTITFNSASIPASGPVTLQMFSSAAQS